MIMMLLNRLYHVIYDASDGYADESFRRTVLTPEGWDVVIALLKQKQAAFPNRNYRLQIWDDDKGWVDHSAVNSKYALFSED